MCPEASIHSATPQNPSLITLWTSEVWRREVWQRSTLCSVTSQKTVTTPPTQAWVYEVET